MTDDERECLQLYQTTAVETLCIVLIMLDGVGWTTPRTFKEYSRAGLRVDGSKRRG